MEETRTGAGTTHCINEIVIQRSSRNCDVAVPLPKGPSKPTRERTLHPSPVELDHYNAGRRKGGTSTKIDIAALDSAQCLSTHIAESMRRDMTWILCRLATEEEIETALGTSQESQLVPSWTDFNIAVSRDVPWSVDGPAI